MSEEELRQQAVLAEYEALRGEILNRHRTLNQILILVVATSGAVLALVGTKDANLELGQLALLSYPLLVTFLANGYSYNDVRVGQLGQYIRTKLEKPPTGIVGLNWETYMDDKLRKKAQTNPNLKQQALTSLNKLFARRGIFVIGTFCGVQLLAILFAYFSSDALYKKIIEFDGNSILPILLTTLDLLFAFPATLIMLTKRFRFHL